VFMRSLDIFYKPEKNPANSSSRCGGF